MRLAFQYAPLRCFPFGGVPVVCCLSMSSLSAMTWTGPQLCLQHRRSPLSSPNCVAWITVKCDPANSPLQAYCIWCVPVARCTLETTTLL
ncbi:hypothetical protein PF005_g29739 [Phytophthora fragariae]|uniref:Uncharacterized protein n=1 Tax=Phytophthora fragariae TaxID=53985 RepID=A0A6A3VXT3_9STRA|nr:hypothetical protein PF003_g12978 [Phytophthora fragariae]KAE8920140.1 hypothetical protein PF009_g29563 [Phytophthora fragariae]KAE8962980.1 hypothetical protein PF011_g29195 [Phytophthora fragariae]KAE9062883.1 hypothetical protein PF010_g29222 [Phytophthora fragariae]KAE9062889.1 hypothetical protein PF007_g29747 [Phytophthora fragariae]